MSAAFLPTYECLQNFIGNRGVFELSKFSCLAETNHRHKSYSECEKGGKTVKLAKALFVLLSLLLFYKITLMNL